MDCSTATLWALPWILPIQILVIVSATDGPGSALPPRRAESYVYRKTGPKRWELAMSGSLEAKGKCDEGLLATRAGRTRASSTPPITTDSSDPMMQGGAGKLLTSLWPEPGLKDGVEALACLPE